MSKNVQSSIIYEGISGNKCLFLGESATFSSQNSIKTLKQYLSMLHGKIKCVLFKVNKHGLQQKCVCTLKNTTHMLMNRSGWQEVIPRIVESAIFGL
jgi:hypothetical protein